MAKMPKWTEGPWSRGGAPSLKIYGRRGQHEVTAPVVCECWVSENKEADAALIAAAPSLYKALAGLVGEADDGAKFSDHMKAARAALALARGEPATDRGE